MAGDAAPLNEREMRAVQDKLDGNALFAALLMTSPADAFKYLGHDFKPTDFDDLRPPTTEDAKLARQLTTALKAGQTTLATPALIQPAGDADSLKPPQPKRKTTRPADITLSVSKATLQYALKTYTEEKFAGQEFDLPALGWWELSAKGKTITLDLTQEHARVVATLQGKVAFSLWLLGFELWKWESNFPIVIDVLAAFLVDDDNQLYLSIGKGEISTTNAPFPVSLASDLVEKIAGMVPYIPIINVPTSFAIPSVGGFTNDEVGVDLSNVRIDDAAVHLELQLESSPRS